MEQEDRAIRAGGTRVGTRTPRGGGGLIGWRAGGVSCRHLKEQRPCQPVPSRFRGCTSDKEWAGGGSLGSHRFHPVPLPGPTKGRVTWPRRQGQRCRPLGSRSHPAPRWGVPSAAPGGLQVQRWEKGGAAACCLHIQRCPRVPRGARCALPTMQLPSPGPGVPQEAAPCRSSGDRAAPPPTPRVAGAAAAAPAPGRERGQVRGGAQPSHAGRPLALPSPRLRRRGPCV